MTSEEMVKILRTCESGDCSSCPAPYVWKPCLDRLLIEAAALIEQLEKEKAALLESLKASVGNCTLCKHDRALPNCDGFCLDCGSVSACSCGTCDQDSNWEWKGLEETDGKRID